MDELDPVEARGLSRASLEAEVRHAFLGLGADRIRALQQRIVDESLARGLLYERDGKAEPIALMLRPIGILPDTVPYLHHVSLTIINALKRVPDLYLQDPAVREMLPLDPGEEQWLRDTWGDRHRDCNAVIGRMDAAVDFVAPMWKESLKFVETNLAGIGGIHLVPICEGIVADVCLPAAREVLPGLDLEPGADQRTLFVHEMLDQLRACGRGGRTLCLIEPKYAGEGPVEQAMLARHLNERYGLQVLHADPSELAMRGGEVVLDGTPIDLAYRDYDIRSLLDLEAGGHDMTPMRTLFRENRIVSSFAGDFDHKSNLELLTDDAFTQRLFTAEERGIFRRHVLWTRVLRERRTSRPDGSTGDLVAYVRGERERLVIKPNRSYGGHAIHIGHLTPAADWERVIDAALADPPGTWVVQLATRIPTVEFPVLDADGALRSEPFFVVMGFAPSRDGLAILGRASQKMVVNIAQRGGICAVFVGRPSAPLVGPQPAGATPSD